MARVFRFVAGRLREILGPAAWSTEKDPITSQLDLPFVRTDFLVAQPFTASGVARIVDLIGVFDSYNESPSTGEADHRALAADWIVIGQDMRAAIAEQPIKLERRPERRAVPRHASASR